jgi:valyl-tRNA synthetase
MFSGHFISFDVQQCHANKLFCNKIWQACKYTRMYIERFPAALHCDLDTSRGDLSKLDRWILSRLAHMVSEVNKALSTSDFHFATSALKTFLYSEFCDFYLVSKCMGN